MGRIFRHWTLGVVAVGLCAALAAGVPANPSPQTQAANPPVPPAGQPPPGEVDTRPIVWVMDGAGDLHGCSTAIGYANLQAGNPVELNVFAWSHGYRRMLLDQTDAAYSRAQGRRLAAKVLERHEREPWRRIVLVAHSAGSAVALSAGDVLPPDTIDRVILLAPSVSTGYDIRPTLRAAREGMDVFCSKKDWVALGFVTRVVGTADRRWAPTAGRNGFRPKGAKAVSECEADRLRQHFWTADVAWTGYTGGHNGTHAPAFVRAYLFPLIEARQ